MSKQDQSPDSCGDDENSKSLLKQNAPQKKVKIETECDEIDCIDWISQLPDELVIKILSLLSVTDAFRTCSLSKRWQYLCNFIDNFIYDNEECSCSDSTTVHKFISLTDNVLPRLSCSSVKKFRLKFAFDHDDGVSYNPKIDKWLEFAVHKISEDCVLNWISLKSLTLGYLFIREEHIEQIMSNCPQLESLKLNGFYGFKRLHMTSPKCMRLDHYHPDGHWGSFEYDCSFEIIAPYVQHLRVSGNFEDAKIRLGNFSTFVHASLTFSRYEYDAIDENIVKDLLVTVRCANELMLSSWFIKEISDLMFEEEDVFFEFLPLLECRRLTISSYITQYSLSGLDNLLRSTPYPENLMIFPDYVPGRIWLLGMWDKVVAALEIWLERSI
ncbi:hypothetical protein T459_04689 [Capsicum annuum]|uniref:F-box domain-containing protein n=1 Tax=Capsicum annuum TaxID=4072 RepID=A0A2G3A5Q8_CAPAN|nr:putative F-box/LRR-repeat protein-like [Capsicum annuum]PHT89576.1 hypothetical protein T459_04689 [Capsicum annuum]